MIRIHSLMLENEDCLASDTIRKKKNLRRNEEYLTSDTGRAKNSDDELRLCQRLLI